MVIMASIGIATVVSAGTLTAATGISSKPLMEMSRGTSRPRRCAAWSMPMAMTSVDAMMAVGGCFSSISTSSASRPPKKVLGVSSR
jgi:hypothetical protein